MKETEWIPMQHNPECKAFEAESPGNHYGNDYEYRGRPKRTFYALDQCRCHYPSLRNNPLVKV